MSYRVLITGGSGFIGTNLVEHYVRQGCHVVNIDCAPPRNIAHTQYWKSADILDRDRLCGLIHEFEPAIILHMAARTDLNGSSIADYRANTEGVQNIIQAARGHTGLRGILFASSMLVCELGYQPKDAHDYRPTTAYGESKVAGERIVRREAADALPWVIARPTSIWGPWFDVPYKNFFTAVARGLYLHPRGARIRRSYGFVYNAVFILDKLVNAARHQASRGVYYVADYDPVELRAWAETIRSTMGAPKVRDVPLSLLVALARIGDALRFLGVRNPPLSSFRLKNLMTEAVYDLELTRASCGELPFGVEEAITLTVEWMRCH